MDWKAFFGHRLFKLVSAATFVGSVYVAQPYRPVVFVGESMAATYSNYEIALGTSDLGDLAAGDVVVISNGDSTIVKRIAYMPGDQIKYTKVARTWIPAFLSVPGLVHLSDRFPTKVAKVPEDEVYVLGDNIAVSIDSRQMGTIPISWIKSKLVNPKPKLDPRSDD